MLAGDQPHEHSDDSLALLGLVASYAIQDVEDMNGRKKGKAKDDPPTDEELALQLFAEEARALENIVRDMAFARSIDQALDTDATLLEEYTRVEEVARRDREIARALAEGRPPPAQASGGPTLSSKDFTSTTHLIIKKASSKTATASSVPKFGMVHIAPTGVASSTPSSSLRRLPNGAKPSLEICVICRDDIRGPVIHAPCGDPYDVECLVDLFRAATIDESLFPPACCRKPFDVSMVRPYLNKDLAALFDEKAIEFGTKDRVYCHRPACSAFLGAATNRSSSLACLKCGYDTCGHCKAAAHSIFTRCTSAEDADVVALAEQSGWKRCPGCGHLVELTYGCYHMTCRCRHQFCYLCAAAWKTCKCEQWDERRLITAAEDRVQRQQRAQAVIAGNAPAPAVINYRQVLAREVERLRVNHDCEHRWRYVSGAGNCEGCGHYLRQFLFNCRNCHTWACARCRRNRWI